MSNILLTTIGTRGEVQPILALALELKTLGHRTNVCAPPDFGSWVQSYGLDFVPIGPPLKGFKMPSAGSGKRVKFSPEQARQMVSASIRNQFQVMGEAAQGADLILVGGALQCAARSFAELLKIPYVYAAYCAMTLPSSAHPPWRVRTQTWPRLLNRLFWKWSDRKWDALFREPVNEQRAALKLAPVDDMTRYIFTDRPWLAADATLSPAGPTRRLNIFQTGAWLLRDSAPLPDTLEQFLAAGDPPIYFGFGSMTSPRLDARTALAATRRLKRRAIVLKGWANLEVDESPDCIAVDEVNHTRLFPRVAAIVHHGGAGTTTAAARAGTPQIIVPHSYDQFYWAHRVLKLGIGTAIRNVTERATDQLVAALSECLKPNTRLRAQSLAPHVEQQGAAIAAKKLVTDFP